MHNIVIILYVQFTVLYMLIFTTAPKASPKKVSASKEKSKMSLTYYVFICSCFE